MEYLLPKIFTHELRVAPEENAVVFTEHDLCIKSDRERLIQVLFETIGVSSLLLVPQSVAGAAAAKDFTGDALVVYSGFDSSYVVPIINYRPSYDKLTRFDQSGEDTTRKLAKLMEQRGYSFTAPHEFEYVQKIKETHCFVAQDRLPVSLTERAFELPDGNMLSVHQERYLCTESMFDNTDNSVQKAVVETLKKLSDAEKGKVSARIVPVGGNTRFSGFAQRLSYELKLLEPRLNLEVLDQREVEHAPYLGALTCSSSPKLVDRWISRQKYDEEGTS